MNKKTQSFILYQLTIVIYNSIDLISSIPYELASKKLCW